MLIKTIKSLIDEAKLALSKADYAKAISLLEEARRRFSPDPTVLSLLGLCYEANKNRDKALETYKQSIKIYPEQPGIYEAIAKIYQDNGEAFNSIAANEEVLKYDPNSYIALNNLGSQLGKLGLIDEALKYLNQALKLKPDLNLIYENILFYHNNSTKITLEETFELAKFYADKLYSQCKAQSFDKANFKTEKLRIAFISADFNRHPVGFFMASLFEEFNKNDFEIYCYYNNDKEDDISQIIKSLSNNFVNIFALNDKDAVEKIISDQITILIDTTGFTNKGRIGVLALKPSPIIVSYLGYFATTGLKQIDYHFADNNVILPDEEKFYTEKIYKFPYCYIHVSPIGMDTAIAEAPFKKNGYISFVSFSTSRKITPEVIQTWSEIIKRVPNSKLQIRTQINNDPEMKEFFVKSFLDCGVSQEQIIIDPFVKREELFDVYNNLDIGLDPFPYGGGITSVETLAMGLPLITWYAPKWMGRVSASILRSIGCEELIAYTLEEYIEKAVALANNPNQILEYRNSLRKKLAQSPLSIKNYTRDFEKALKEIWDKLPNTQPS